MLDHIVPIEWQRAGAGFSGRPAQPLPDILADLDTRIPSAANPIAPGQADGARIRMNLPWLFRGAGLVAMAAPLRYAFDTGRFLISSADIDRVRGRLARAHMAPPVPIDERIVGCCGQLNEPAVTPRFAAASGFGASGYFGDAANWFLFDGPRPGDIPPLTPPDAVVFHDDGMPPRVSMTIEATTACNFRCGFCYGRYLKQGVMRPADFTALLDSVPELAVVEFIGEGEPLMNRDTPAMIRACKERGIWVHLTSNGSRMTPERAEMILDLGVESFAVSLESIDPDRFAHLRPGGNLKDLEEAIALLRSAIVRRGRGPELRLWVSLLRDTLGEVDAFFDYGDRHGFDHVEFQTLNSMPAFRRLYPEFLKDQVPGPADVSAALAAPGLSQRGRVALAGVMRAFEGASCHRFMHVLAPSWRLHLSPCTLLKEPDHPSLGDMRQRPLSDIWNEPVFRRFRFALQHGAILKSCDGCVYIAGAGGAASGPGEDVDLVEEPAHLGPVS